MTERLYYSDSYLRQFQAEIVERLEINDHPVVVLDRSAFYPESGGQPSDTGWLEASTGARVGVVDVQVRETDGTVLHFLDRPLAAARVSGGIDWSRRWDHMQQHTGQHILSQAFIQIAEAETVSFHLGSDSVTIDLAHPPFTAEEISAVEERANWAVTTNLPVTARFVSPENLPSVPLRKPPSVSENIRIVEVAGFDWSACGGTHVMTSAEVGLIKVRKMDRRGKETRVEFVCGHRALADYARKQRIVQTLIGQLTCSEDELPDAVAKLRAEAEATRRSLRFAEGQIVEDLAPKLFAGAEVVGGQPVICRSIADLSAESLRSLAQKLQTQGPCVALLAWAGDRPQLFFARGSGATGDMGALMRTACAAVSGKGGGRPDWAQGNVPAGQANTALEAALSVLKS